jgi:hypothetical protein
VATEKKVRTVAKKYVPIASERPIATDKEESTTSPNGPTIAETPMQFYTRVTKRRDVRNILSRLAKE